MFFALPASRVDAPSTASTARIVSVVIGIRCTRYSLSEPSSSGLVAYSAFSRLRFEKASSLTMIVAPRAISATFAFNAAGFMATRTFGNSPGVRMSRDAKWIWNAETPATVPAGARISAGKSGMRGDVVAEHRRRISEAAADELHAVARVARETDDHVFAFFFYFIHAPSDR